MSMPQLTPGQEFLLSLERERYYRPPIQTTKPDEVVKFVSQPVKCRKRHVTDERDQILFNAGRYAAGARDKTAIKAYDTLLKESE